MTILGNKTFYPTPPDLAAKMVKKIDLKDNIAIYGMNVLEPSAGSGDLIEALNKDRYDGFHGDGTFRNIFAIEIDPDLRATLKGKGIKVIDSDFLAYSGPDKFDLIIANPPFDDGDKHLLKAINILYRGQIIFLLNAETIRNPYTNNRKELVKKLKELNAEIEYIEGAFENAERSSGVEVAIVNIKIDREVEDDLFKGCDDKAASVDDEEFEEQYEVSTGRKVEELVAEYNQIIKIGTDTIIGYYQNYRKIGHLIGLNYEPGKCSSSKARGDLTGMMQETLNKLLTDARRKFWRKTLELPDVTKRMTSAKQKEFDGKVEHQCDMDFTENNIRTFILNLIGSYEKTLMEAVLDIFNLFTVRHSWNPDKPDEQNIHYFNGWKTNKAFKVNKKVIVPMYLFKNAGYSWAGWKVDYRDQDLRDIDTVMNYFDGMSNYYSMFEALTHAFTRGETKKIESEYFTVNCYKKGTIHLTFNDENILRRFNVAACMGKKWLPCDYGAKGFDELPMAEKDVVESFEGRKSYTLNRKQPIFARNTSMLQLEEVTQKQATMF